jgi:hypothetical protein
MSQGVLYTTHEGMLPLGQPPVLAYVGGLVNFSGRTIEWLLRRANHRAN